LGLSAFEQASAFVPAIRFKSSPASRHAGFPLLSGSPSSNQHYPALFKPFLQPQSLRAKGN
jgi:hypothetical protein